MATAIVSGRVDERIKERADAVIATAGSSSGEVIRRVWTNIAYTGELPTDPDEERRNVNRHEQWESFMRWRSSHAKGLGLAAVTDEDIYEIVASDNA